MKIYVITRETNIQNIHSQGNYSIFSVIAVFLEEERADSVYRGVMENKTYLEEYTMQVFDSETGEEIEY